MVGRKSRYEDNIVKVTDISAEVTDNSTQMTDKVVNLTDNFLEMIDIPSNWTHNVN